MGQVTLMQTLLQQRPLNSWLHEFFFVGFEIFIAYDRLDIFFIVPFYFKIEIFPIRTLYLRDYMCYPKWALLQLDRKLASQVSI